MKMVSKVVKSKPKVKCKVGKDNSKKKIFRLIHEPTHWICDIQKCKLINKSVLKQPRISQLVEEKVISKKPVYDEKQPMDITLTLDALENEIVSQKSHKRISETSTCSSNKKLSFSNVSVFYFNRTLGQSSVPRDGLHPLGMGMKHVDYEKMKVSLYNSNNSDTNRVTRAKTEQLLKTKKQQNLNQNFTSFPFPTPPAASKIACGASSTVSVPSKENISKVKDGLFQQMCSNPGPRKMFSSSSLLKLRDSPAFRDSLPKSYFETSDKFPWQPHKMTSRGQPGRPRRSLRNTESKGLASAFSQKLKVQDIIETLPKPEKKLLNAMSQNCLISYNNYHKSSGMDVDTNFDKEEFNSNSSSPSVSSSSRQPLRRSKRKLEESGTRGMKVLSARDRMTLLRPYGVNHVAKEDTKEIVDIQTSRETGGGCSCQDGCISSKCECQSNNITCHLEYAGFPCSCLSTCGNPMGRRVFDHVAVALHFINTMFTAEGVMDISDQDAEVMQSPRKKQKR